MTEFGEDLGEALGVISEEVPYLLRAVTRMLSFPFDEEIREAAASFYEELHETGMPDQTALKLTENYVSVFTDQTEEVMKQVQATRMLRSAETERDEIRKETKKGLGDRLSSLKARIKMAFRSPKAHSP